MNTSLKTLCIIIVTTFSLCAQSNNTIDTSSNNTLIADSLLNLKTNSVNLSPISAIFGVIDVNYEHLFGSKHGLLLEGGISFSKNYSALIGYRYHYYSNEDEYGLISPFWGFFIHKARSSSEFEDQDTKKKYKYKIELTTVGIHWGQRFAWGETFNYTWRIGYGYPVVLIFDWPNGKPSKANTVEGLIKVFSGFDAELSIGIVF